MNELWAQTIGLIALLGILQVLMWRHDRRKREIAERTAAIASVGPGRHEVETPLT